MTEHLKTDLDQAEQRRRRRRKRTLAITISAAAAAVISAVGVTYAATRPQTCDDPAAELQEAIEDGTLMDGTFEPSPACAEQLRKDLSDR